MTPEEVAAAFAPSGLLSCALPGFTPREAQAVMAEGVAQALAAAEPLIVEAGTGTGKTYAYLVPVLASEQRVVISTGTKNLQDQLFARDLPRMLGALNSTKRVSLLKGRANYLCLHRIDKASQDVRTRAYWPQLNAIAQQAKTLNSGEVAELSGPAPDEALLPRITSTADNCLGAKCPDFASCFVVKARRAAAAADVVVVNHALLFADHLVRQEGFAVLPGADAVVIDEAHQLPELALRHFGSRVSTQQLHALVRDTSVEVERWHDVPSLSEALANLADANTRLEGCFANASRMRLREFVRGFGINACLDATGAALDEVVAQLSPLEERTAEFANALERAYSLQEKWQKVAFEGQGNEVRWVEPLGRGGVLNATPLEVATQFAAMRSAHPGSWIFTSATLAVGNDFGHFSQPLGLANAPTLKLESPYQFDQQCRLWLPPELPQPNEPGYLPAVSAALLPLIRASNGGAFVLCTSHRALTQISHSLRSGLPGITVLAQGELPKPELIEKFVADGNAVLVATASFWEGVDVKGRALRLVAIDRLPFAAPGDPVLDAKLDAISEAGGNPFNDEQLPRAIVTLRQGVGRLIRDETDQGLLVLCDPRVTSKPYGKRVLAALPAMPRLATLALALDYCKTL